MSCAIARLTAVHGIEISEQGHLALPAPYGHLGAEGISAGDPGTTLGAMRRCDVRQTRTLTFPEARTGVATR